ncbi:MAG: phosphoribosylformylglycinamidine cyclo-ligase [Bacteroidales bacterium]|nr:phosphoribosylformylglycinamidine cyclo-ligase [Bacteroidales bacterium]
MADNNQSLDRYSLRGVSSQKEDVHKAIKNVDKGLFPKAFCKITEDVYSKGEADPWCCVMHADGAGTKSSLAYAYWRETGDLSVWDGISQDAIVMNTDDLLCVGITDNIYISSTIGRNKNLIPGEVIERLISGSEKFVAKMKEFGVTLIPTGGETADVGDLVRTVIADTTVYAKIRRSQVIDNANIRPGDVIVGLASDGKATYEDTYNGGMGSNGLTSARHDVFAKYLGWKYPESYDGAMPKELVYSGTRNLTDIEPETGMTYGKLVLSPTRTYAPVVKQVLDRMRSRIHGMIHCTGGAQTKILHFVDNVRIVKDNMFPVPVLFRTIQKESGTPWNEMMKVFNMGHRLEFYVGESDAQEIIRISGSFGIPARVIGRVEKGSPDLPRLTVSCPMGEFNYK